MFLEPEEPLVLHGICWYFKHSRGFLQGVIWGIFRVSFRLHLGGFFRVSFRISLGFR